MCCNFQSKIFFGSCSCLILCMCILYMSLSGYIHIKKSLFHPKGRVTKGIKSKSKLGFYVPFNSQGHIGTGPQNCHLWDSNPQR